ncbi:MAG: SdrD B-like domain-containing protein, partial [Caldilineaceae bacterium]
VSGQDDLAWDAGIFDAPNVGNRIWLDTDGNGLQNAGEDGVPGLTVRLINLDNGLIVTDTTDLNGNYGFFDVPPGNYEVEFVPPPGHSFTLPLQNGDREVDSNAIPASGRSAPFLLQSGEINVSIDAGVYRPAIALKKYTNGDDADAPPGPTISERSPVTWTYYVTNTGNVRLETLALVDSPQGAISCPVSALDVGQSTLCVAGAGALLGNYVNTATVSAAPPTTTLTVSATDLSHYTGVPRVITLTATPLCINDVPRVDVLVDGLNFTPESSTPLTLTWQTVTGTIVATLPNQPLSVNGLLWPGAAVDGNGRGVDWPGWDQDPNGVWFAVPTDLRPNLVLVASVNPPQSVSLAYPPADPICVAAPRGYIGDFVWNDTTADG